MQHVGRVHVLQAAQNLHGRRGHTTVSSSSDAHQRFLRSACWGGACERAPMPNSHLVDEELEVVVRELLR